MVIQILDFNVPSTTQRHLRTTCQISTHAYLVIRNKLDDVVDPYIGANHTQQVLLGLLFIFTLEGNKSTHTLEVDASMHG